MAQPLEQGCDLVPRDIIAFFLPGDANTINMGNSFLYYVGILISTLVRSLLKPCILSLVKQKRNNCARVLFPFFFCRGNAVQLDRGVLSKKKNCHGRGMLSDLIKQGLSFFLGSDAERSEKSGGLSFLFFPMGDVSRWKKNVGWTKNKENFCQNNFDKTVKNTIVAVDGYIKYDNANGRA